MKTLKDLKQNAHKYEWSLVKNSWYENVPEFQKAYRKVGRVLTNKFSLLTLKNGIESESWIDLPKASELQIKHFGLDFYEITIERVINEFHDGSIQYHVMKYKLKPILELFNAA